MMDTSLAGTQRFAVKVDAHDATRDPPDYTVEFDIFLEADGCTITDPDRIRAILDKQAEDATNAT